MKTFKIKSFCKINLFLKVVKKLSNGYHNIVSLITFCNLHDIISISKTSNLNDKISFTGDFKKGINTKSNTATDVLNLLRQKGLIGNQKYKMVFSARHKRQQGNYLSSATFQVFACCY